MCEQINCFFFLLEGKIWGERVYNPLSPFQLYILNQPGGYSLLYQSHSSLGDRKNQSPLKTNGGKQINVSVTEPLLLKKERKKIILRCCTLLLMWSSYLSPLRRRKSCFAVLFLSKVNNPCDTFYYYKSSTQQSTIYCERLGVKSDASLGKHTHTFQVGFNFWKPTKNNNYKLLPKKRFIQERERVDIFIGSNFPEGRKNTHTNMYVKSSLNC